MKQVERITKKIEADKKLLKAINNHYGFRNSPIDGFISDVKRYIKAIKEGRMLCSIPHVSSSGMSRTIKFNECAKGKTHYNYQQFWTLFKTLGYTESRVDNYGFTISGCGMDMVFHTNYSNIHVFGHLGFLNKRQVEYLSQQTPIVL
jgi:hypothetical protein